jgi:hypothetical protein
MTGPAQLAFLSKLDTTAAPPNTIFLFTANGTAKLAERFLSRCRVVEFTHEGLLDPARELLARIWRAETSAAAPDFEVMLRAAGFNLRTAITALEVELIAPSPPGRGKTLCAVFSGEAIATRSPRHDPRIPPAGTTLTREFKGKQIAVDVLADGGFRYSGRRFNSLSAIAREVTKANQNGYRFFRLKVAS